jgi:hypothetical protein
MSEVVRESLRNSNTAMDILNRTTRTYIHRYLLLALKSGRTYVFDFPWITYVNGQRADVLMRIKHNKVSLSFERDNIKLYETEEYGNLQAFARLYKEYGFDGDTLVRTKVSPMLDKMVGAGFDRKINPDDIRNPSSFF